MIVDHNEPVWSRRYRRSHVVRGRENGAATYSREIVTHQAPVWSRFAPPDALVSTCPLLSRVPDLPAAPFAVQYLHTIRHPDPLSEPREVVEALNCPVVFVTAYRALHYLMSRAGYTSLFVPMTVDTATVRAAAGPQPARLEQHRALWFGNVTSKRQPEFRTMQAAFAECGWGLDVISDGTFNGTTPVSQEEAWSIASRYRYGVGVGRAALEMHALGLRVIYAGADFGGIATTPAEWEVQQSANFGGGVTTYSRRRDNCIASYELGLTDPPELDSSHAAEVLRDGLVQLLDRGWFDAAA